MRAVGCLDQRGLLHWRMGRRLLRQCRDAVGRVYVAEF